MPFCVGPDGLSRAIRCERYVRGARACQSTRTSTELPIRGAMHDRRGRLAGLERVRGSIGQR